MDLAALVLAFGAASILLAVLGSRLFSYWLFNRSEIEDHQLPGRKPSEYAGQINSYFVNAVEAWIFADDDAARLSALTAAKVTGSIQRQSLVEYLTGMAGDWAFAAPGHRNAVAMRLRTLALEISERNWDIPDAISAKRALFSVDEEYGRALDEADPEVFHRRHPQLTQRPRTANPPERGAANPPASG